MRLLNIFAIFVLLLSCKANIRGRSEKETPVVNKQAFADTSSKEIESTKTCLQILSDLIAETDLAKEIPKDFTLVIDDSTMTGYVLKIGNINEERGDMVPIKWIEIDFQKRQLYDITNDPNNRIPIKFNNNIFKKLINCFRK
jgi:hypothetical protein